MEYVVCQCAVGHGCEMSLQPTLVWCDCNCDSLSDAVDPNCGAPVSADGAGNKTVRPVDGLMVFAALLRSLVSRKEETCGPTLGTGPSCKRRPRDFSLGLLRSRVKGTVAVAGSRHRAGEDSRYLRGRPGGSNGIWPVRHGTVGRLLPAPRNSTSTVHHHGGRRSRQNRHTGQCSRLRHW